MTEAQEPRRQFHLSTDETAMVMAYLGDGELALKVLLASAAPPTDPEQVRGRLLAGSMALEEQGLLSIEADGVLRLDDDLVAVGQVSASPEFTLGISRSRAGVNANVSFHFGEGRIVVQRREDDDRYEIEEVDGLEAVVLAATAFFAVTAVALASADGDEVSLPAALLEDVAAAGTAAEATAMLSERGAAESLLRLFAADYVTPALKGGFVRTDYGHGHPVSEAGALVVGGDARVWLLRLDGRTAGNLLVVPATRDSLREEIVRLTRSRA